MEKNTILSKIIDEQNKIIANLQSSVEHYKNDSDMDEDNTLDPDDYARQNEAKDMQLRFEKLLKEALLNLKFIENSKSEVKDKIEAGSLVETDKNYFFVGVSVPVFKFENKEVISFSEDAPVYNNVKNRKIGDIFEIGNNSFEIKKIL